VARSGAGETETETDPRITDAITIGANGSRNEIAPDARGVPADRSRKGTGGHQALGEGTTGPVSPTILRYRVSDPSRGRPHKQGEEALRSRSRATQAAPVQAREERTMVQALEERPRCQLQQYCLQMSPLNWHKRCKTNSAVN
jgi:hypothetical protein